jgi:DNA-directed RNA polymerase specialized sigma subunit
MTDLYDCQDQDDIDDKIDAEIACAKFSHINKAVLYLYVIGYTQTEIGAIVGYSHQHISRILRSMCKSA